MKNKAAFVLAKRQMEIRPVEMPTCGEEEVLVQILYCGVCGSDVHFYEHGEPAFPDVYPFILGHECAGLVVQTGSRVDQLQVGDKVALEPGITCGACEWCKTGRYNLCPSVKFLSAPNYHGALRTYVSHPASLCFKLPDTISALEGALIEPLSVGVNAVVHSGICLGQTALVLGAGCIGLTTLLALKAIGISQVTMADLHDIRLARAKELGSAHTINAARQNLTEAAAAIYGPYGPDFVFETAGSTKTAAQTVGLVKRGGTIVMVGNTVGETPFNFQLFVDKEVSMQSVFRYRNIYPTVIEALASKKIEACGIISKVYPFEEAPQAFEDAIHDKQNMIKAVIQVSTVEDSKL